MFHNRSMNKPNSRNAFTLIELLVVIAVISILMGLTIPAVQAVRRSAQSLSCKNNLKNIGLAVLNFQTSQGSFPVSFEVPSGTTVRGSWSIHSRIMPYMEEDNAYKNIDFLVDWHDQVATGVPAYAVPTYTCPSEPNTKTREQGGSPYVHGTNYGFNMGEWLVHNPVNGVTGNGAFRVNRATQPKDFTDGLSRTLCATDVKAYTPYIRNVDTIDPTLPTLTTQFDGVTGQLKLGPLPDSNTGHTVWCDGRVHHTGITSVFAPNTRVPYNYMGFEYDIDYSSQQEGRDLTRPTYAAVTSRSYHPAGVNASNMDGSVHFVTNSIDLEIWRALSTASGGEIIDTSKLD